VSSERPSPALPRQAEAGGAEEGSRCVAEEAGGFRRQRKAWQEREEAVCRAGAVWQRQARGSVQVAGAGGVCAKRRAEKECLCRIYASERRSSSREAARRSRQQARAARRGAQAYAKRGACAEAAAAGARALQVK